MRSSALVACAVVCSVAVAHAQTPTPPATSTSPRIEGFISVALESRLLRSNAAAEFARSPRWGTAIATDGPCTLYKGAAREGLSAGMISINGTVQPITLEETRNSSGVMYRHTAPVPQ